ncbi:MAG: hypothetical protein GY948_20415 [Alphaproteobacteria bacterium]|nr:hypothetical protein [Alphaproteobacteria bacterium]
MNTSKPEQDRELHNLQKLPLLFLTGFFALFALAFLLSPSFNALVGQAFGGLHEAVVTMVAWCRSL